MFRYKNKNKNKNKKIIVFVKIAVVLCDLTWNIKLSQDPSIETGILLEGKSVLKEMGKDLVIKHENHNWNFQSFCFSPF